VTYLRSREARKAESDVGDVYERVYEAERPELFPKALGWRVVGHKMPIRIRSDSRWNVPEPELTLVVNRQGEIIGFCAGNDVSSREILRALIRSTSPRPKSTPAPVLWALGFM
jgi:2-dehydro-3-deoxy-D-arabinonate dehydratase